MEKTRRESYIKCRAIIILMINNTCAIVTNRVFSRVNEKAAKDKQERASMTAKQSAVSNS